MKKQTAIDYLQKNTPKKLNALDKYCIFSFSVLIIYSITELVLSSVTGTSHDTLTTCLYSAFGGELLLCAMIKRLKIRSEDKQ